MNYRLLLFSLFIYYLLNGYSSNLFGQNVSMNGQMDIPTIDCPADIMVYVGVDSCSAFVGIPQPEVTSTCGEYDLVNDYNFTDDASDLYITGTTIINWTVTDTCGEASCSMQVFVIDTIPPTIISLSDTITFTNPHFCGANLSIPIPEVTDNCEVFEFWNDYTFINDASAAYNIGTTEVKWYAKDVFDNIDSCVMMVHVEDDDPPVISCIDDTLIHIPPDSNFVFVEIPAPLVLDNCMVNEYWNDYTLTSDASAVYLVGETVVNWTVTDMFENVNTCSIIVHVAHGTSIDENELSDITFTTDFFGDKLILVCDSEKQMDIKYQLFDMMGRELLSGIRIISEGENNISVDITGISKGIYAVSLSSSTQRFSKAIHIP